MDGMRTKTKVLSLAALLTGSVVFGMILAGPLDFTKHASAKETSAASAVAAAATAEAPTRAPQMIALPSFADIAEQVMPAIVSVTATDIIKADKRRRSFHNFGNPDGSDPFEFFFGPDGPRRKGADDDEDQKQLSGGTGFLIESDGYILTNNHVIEGADKIEVKVGDKDDYAAKIVGRDPASDLALLKIDGARPFPTVKLGDSDRIRVGEWGMAIGDPLNLDKAGLKREDIITKVDDVAVKNNRDLIDYVSGKGPGTKVTIAYLRDGREKTAVATLEERVEAGEKPSREEEDSRAGKQKMLGLELDELTPQARRAYGLDRELLKGVIITHVKPVSPAGDANLQEGDVILEVNGTAVGSVEELQAQIRKAPKGKYVRFYVQRGGGHGQALKFLAAVKPE